jgi:hypothetical protein
LESLKAQFDIPRAWQDRGAMGFEGRRIVHKRETTLLEKFYLVFGGLMLLTIIWLPEVLEKGYVSDLKKWFKE